MANTYVCIHVSLILQIQFSAPYRNIFFFSFFFFINYKSRTGLSIRGYMMAFLILSYNYYGVLIFLKKNNVIKVYVLKIFFFFLFFFFLFFIFSLCCWEEQNGAGRGGEILTGCKWVVVETERKSTHKGRNSPTENRDHSRLHVGGEDRRSRPSSKDRDHSGLHAGEEDRRPRHWSKG